MAAHPVTIVAFDDFQSLDLTGPMEVINGANRLAGAGYAPRIVSPTGTEITSDSGLRIGVDGRVRDVAAGDAAVGTLLVIGGGGTRRLRKDASFLADVRRLAGRADRVTSVCTGALVLAAAGLLDGHTATTHWNSCAFLAREHPEVDVDPDRIFVRDGDVWTSAGVTAGIDLWLSIVEHDHGPEVAHEIARWLVVFVQRPGGQSQFSAQLGTAPAASPPIVALQRWLPDHLADDLTVERLAESAGLSPRTLARRFRAETGTTPAAYVEALRIEAARRILETTDLTVAAVASQVGLGRPETLHRAFRRRTGTTPDQYRAHFGRRAS